MQDERGAFLGVTKLLFWYLEGKGSGIVVIAQQGAGRSIILIPNVRRVDLNALTDRRWSHERKLADEGQPSYARYVSTAGNHEIKSQTFSDRAAF